MTPPVNNQLQRTVTAIEENGETAETIPGMGPCNGPFAEPTGECATMATNRPTGTVC